MLGYVLVRKVREKEMRWYGLFLIAGGDEGARAR